MNWRIRNIKEDWLDFRSMAGIQKRTGISQEDLLEAVVKELVDNSLDEGGTCELGSTSRGFYVQDEGDGIPGSDDDIAYLFSIKRPRISTKNLRLPKRGCLGEGLRLCAAVSLNLNYDIEVSTRGRTLKLEPLSSGYTKYTVTGSYDKKGTRIEVLCGSDANSPEDGRDILKWGKLAIEMARGGYYGGKSSPFWYDSASFDEFLTTLEMPDNYTLSHVIEEAFGIEAFIHCDNSINNNINKKVLELTVKDKDILLNALREEARKRRPRLNGNVDPVLLGNVGTVPGFDFYSTSKGFYRYTGKEGSLDAELPFVLEIWGKMHPLFSDAEIFINKSPVMKHVYCSNDEKHLKISGCGIDGKFPAKSGLALRINIITPYVPLSSNSKTPDLKEMSNDIYKALGDVVKQSNKAYDELHGNVKKRKFIVMKEPSELLEGKIDDTSHKNIRIMANEMKMNIEDLVALAPKNDPFNSGTKTHKILAVWFKEWRDRLGYDERTKAHLRRVHYQIYSTKSPRPSMHNGKDYFNTRECWTYLCEASKHARYLGLVDPELIIDMRNPEPIYPDLTAPCNPNLTIEPLLWQLPAIAHSLKDTLNFNIPEFQVEGYEYNNLLQPYHLEIWCEKSTMDDILLPLCKRYSVTLRKAVGFFTITRVLEMIGDVLTFNKPVRIFYISDFDPAGVNMPVSVARQTEYWLKKPGKEGIEIKLHNIFLTREQVIKYELPRKPIKDSDGRKKNFEDKFGTGAVELDALEALYPGEFKKIVEKHILECYDTDLEEKVDDRKRQARKLAKRHWGETIYPYTNELEAIRTAMRNITAGYDDKLKTLNASMDKELSPYKERLEELQSTLQEVLENAKYEIELPDLPESGLNEDNIDWLFESNRDYMTQLKYYRKAQTKKSKK